MSRSHEASEFIFFSKLYFIQGNYNHRLIHRAKTLSRRTAMFYSFFFFLRLVINWYTIRPFFFLCRVGFVVWDTIIQSLSACQFCFFFFGRWKLVVSSGFTSHCSFARFNRLYRTLRDELSKPNIHRICTRRV